jgi:hypothetical protein
MIPGCCCARLCAKDPTVLCDNMPCSVWAGMPTAPHGCDSTLGAGLTQSPTGNDCGITGGNRYLLADQPRLDEVFSCLARVGVQGENNERPMAAMMQALGPLNQPGECNAGFLRDDALLVVVLITDEEEDPHDGEGGGSADPNSPGDPETWQKALLEAKHGDPQAVVVLALIGDLDIGGICQPRKAMIGAEPAPRLRAFAQLFPFGSTGSVCADNYRQFFVDAVRPVNEACQVFRPPR